jgi:hypothetical protein
MNARLDDPTTTSDPILRGILIMTMAITIVGMLALIRAAVAGDVHHVTVQVDTRQRWPFRSMPWTLAATGSG